VTGRWAPSPTGHFHLGNLRTALLAWLFTRSAAESLIWRFEDLDNAVRPEFYRSQIRDFQRIGLDWDGEPVRQSSRVGIYRDAIGQLAKQGLTYRCWCTRREIREATSAPHAHLPEGAYPGTCRGLTRQQISQHEASGREPALRLRTQGEVVKIQDRQLGNFEGAVDDFVLCRGDGVPSYNLGVVVDDADLGVTEVVRGDDLLPSTPRQVHLFGLLGLNPPSYAHVPLVIAPSGERLAKRHGAVTMEDRLSLGESELDVLNILLSSLRIEKVASFGQLSERVKVFDSTSLPLAPWIFRD